MFSELPEGDPQFPRAIYDVKGHESSRLSTLRRGCLFSQCMIGLVVFPDFILKAKNTAALSGKYLLFFFFNYFFGFLLK